MQGHLHRSPLFTTMRIFLATLLFLAAGALGACPGVEEPCMTEENHQKCMELVEKGCTNLLCMESCPLQFTCAEYAHKSLRSKPSTSKPKPKPKQPDSCVSLYVYDDHKCTGKPTRTMTFPTYSQPGSPCYHDVSMGHLSVENQYCNLKTGNWHETFHAGKDDCSNSWWAPEGMDLTFTTDSCIGGYSLKECHQGPCRREDEANIADKDTLGSTVVIPIVAEKIEASENGGI
jgi:hypothetical protein